MSSPSKSALGLQPSLLIAFFAGVASILLFQWDTLTSRKPEIVMEPLARNVSNILEPENTQHPFDRMSELYSEACPNHDYQVRLFSHDPLIIYVENFLSEEERSYMVAKAEAHYQRSQVIGDDNVTGPSEDRTSESAFIYSEPVADCIRKRAADFQGGIPMENLEDLQAVKYHVGKQFRNHYDWAENDANPRISTFFVYAACDPSQAEPVASAEGIDAESYSYNRTSSCLGGSTNFPDYENEISRAWCGVIDCEDEDNLGGVSFKAIPGNAVFWSNVYPNGTFHLGTLHAGVPVKSGTKVGLNIWTRKKPFHGDEYIEVEPAEDFEAEPAENVEVSEDRESDYEELYRALDKESGYEDFYRALIS